MNLRELPPIRLEREWFFKVSWEDEHQLKVVLGAMNPDEKTDIHCFAIPAPRPSNKPLERTGCAGRSAIR